MRDSQRNSPNQPKRWRGSRDPITVSMMKEDGGCIIERGTTPERPQLRVPYMVAIPKGAQEHLRDCGSRALASDPC
jgi:hypothetical protein